METVEAGRMSPLTESRPSSSHLFLPPICVADSNQARRQLIGEGQTKESRGSRARPVD